LVLAATFLTLSLGFAHKSLCVGEAFSDRAFRWMCYSDLVELHEDGRFTRGLPYLEARSEYPVGSGLFMWAPSLAGDGAWTFFATTALALSSLAILTSTLLFRAVGDRALYFALAPSLFLYAFLNWDLLAVTLAMGASLAYLRRRDALAGVLVGLGVAAKVYPLLLIVPFALGRRREGDRDGSIRIVGWAAGSWLVLNIPFLVFAFDRWSEFLRFSSERLVHRATLWFLGCRALTGESVCTQVEPINWLSLAAFVVTAVLVWRAKVAREPDVPRWALTFPLIVLFLLTSKVYSPQYSLWLVPWFALVLPDLRLFAAFETMDVAAFATEFAWLGGGSIWLLEVAVVLRAVVLVIILVAFVRRPTMPLAAPMAASVTG
jgi:uncharacterized membrane protein